MNHLVSLSVACEPVHQTHCNDLSIGHRRQGSAANDSIREEVADVETDLYINVLSALLRLMQVRALTVCVLETSYFDRGGLHYKLACETFRREIEIITTIFFLYC